MKLQNSLFTVRAGIAAVLFLVTLECGVLAQPSWYDAGSNSGIQPGSPDFYQHQIQESGTNGGFCDFFAYEDAMYYDSTIGFPNLYTNSANWVNAMVGNFSAIAATDGTNQFSYMRNYLATQGYGGTLGINISINSSNNSMWDGMRGNLLAGSNVLVHILPPAPNTNQWWSYHVMDVVGFAVSNHSIIVLDPDNTRYGAIGFPGSAASPPPTGFYTNYAGYGIPYTLSAYTNSQAFPVESGWGNVGDPTNSLLQAYAVNADGFITSGIYAGTYVDGFFAIGPVPEPSAIALGALSTAVFVMYRRRRNRSKGERNASRWRSVPRREV
jgi:hypothetical protein